MAEDHQRKAFLDKLVAFNEERGHNSNTQPTISKQPLDLYLLYSAVKTRGGFVEVSKSRTWKEVANFCGITLSSSAAYTLKKQYVKHLLPFEARFDHGDIDVQALIAQAESSGGSGKGKAKHGKGSAPSPLGPGDSNSQGSISSASNCSYPTSGTPNPGDTNTSTIPPPHPSPSPGYGGPPSSQHPQQPPPTLPPGHPGGNAYNGSPYGPPAPPHSSSPYGHPPPHPGQPLPPPAGQQPPPHHQWPSHPHANESVSAADPFSDNMQANRPGPPRYSQHPQQNQYPPPPRNDTRPFGHMMHRPDMAPYGPPPHQPPSHLSQGKVPPSTGPGQAPPGAPYQPRYPSMGPISASRGTMPPHAMGPTGSYPQPSGPYNPMAPQQAPTQPSQQQPGQQQPQMKSQPMPPSSQHSQQPPTGHPSGSAYNGSPYGPQPHSSAPYGHPHPGQNLPPPHGQQPPPHHQWPSHPPHAGESVSATDPFSDNLQNTRSTPRYSQHPQQGPYPPQPPPPHPPSQSTPSPHGPGEPNSQGSISSASNSSSYPTSGTPNAGDTNSSPMPPHPSPSPGYGPPHPSQHPSQHPPQHPSQHPPQHPQQHPGHPSSSAYNGSPYGPPPPPPHSSAPYGHPHPGQPPLQQPPQQQQQQPPPPPPPQGQQPPPPPHHQWPPSHPHTNESVSATDPFSDNMQANRSAPQRYPQHPQHPQQNQYPPPPRNDTRPFGGHMMHRPEMTPYGPPPHQPPSHLSQGKVPPSTGPGQAPPGAPYQPRYPPPMAPMSTSTRASMPPHGPPIGPSGSYPPQPSGPYNPMAQQPAPQQTTSQPPGQPQPPPMKAQPMPGPGPVPYPPSQAPMYNQMSQQPIKKEITFPPGSIEAAQPVLIKKRKFTSRDLSQIEAWRLLMCLKSGLLAESSWALDVLTVMIHDDNTYLFFGLQNMPGLLDTLLEHYKKYLSEIFEGLFTSKSTNNCINANQTVVTASTSSTSFSSKTGSSDDGPQSKSDDEELLPSVCRYKLRRNAKGKRLKWFEIDEDLKENSIPTMATDELINEISSNEQVTSNDKASSLSKGLLKQLPSGDPLVLLNGALNFTMKTRDGKPVKMVNCKNSHELLRRLKALSPSTNLSNGDSDGDLDGNGNCNWDPSCHILTHFACKEKFVRFVKLIKTSSSSSNSFFSPSSFANSSSLSSSPSSEVKSAQNHPSNSVANDLHNVSQQQASQVECTKDATTTPVMSNGLIDSHSEGKANGPAGKEAARENQADTTRDESMAEETYPRFKPGCKRRKQHDLFDELEEEAYHRDHPPLYAVDEYSEGLAKRCLCLSTLIRNLSFVPGNDLDMAKHPGLLMVLSRLLLLNHEHPHRKKQLHVNKSLTEDKGDESLFNEIEMEEKTNENADATEEEEEDIDTGSEEWYWDTMHLILENCLVTLANLSGQLDLTPFPEEISLPLLDGLLHWAVCPSAYAQDHLPTTSLTNLSPQRLALETLVKLSIREVNVDLILATPPWERLDRMFKMLPKLLSRNEDQTLREFALVLLVNLTSADPLIARAVALTGSAIPQLVSFVEMSEQSAMNVAHTHGVNALRENPELMGTTLDMVRRAALCLRAMSRIPENRALFMVFQQRLLNLVMSQILDQGVAAIMADVVYECSLSDPTLNGPKEVFLPYILPSATTEHISHSSVAVEEHTGAGATVVATPATSANSTEEVNSTPVASSVATDGSLESVKKEADPSKLVADASNLSESTKTPQVVPVNGMDSKDQLDSVPKPIPNSDSLVVSSKDRVNSNSNSADNSTFESIQAASVPLNNSINNSSSPPSQANQVASTNETGTGVGGGSGEAGRGCPRLKELLLSYQMSPKFDSSPTSVTAMEPAAEQIS